MKCQPNELSILRDQLKSVKMEKECVEMKLKNIELKEECNFNMEQRAQVK